MRKSEIFESFIKIAQERGLVSQADHAEHTETSFSETNPRMDSLSIEQISKLYNTKPARPEDMDYKKNIMEDAHPDRVVLSPSHDKLNGLVENEIDGQNIRIHISLKDPDGHLTQRKYAKKNLVLSLVSIGNELDNSGSDELRKLADACLHQISGNPIKKYAQGWEIALVVAALGAIYAKNHLRFHSDGWAADYQKAIAEIDDLLNSNTNFGVGYAYTPQFIQTVNGLKQALDELNAAVTKALPILEKMETPKNADELKKMINEPETREAIGALDQFKQVMEKTYPYINKVITDFSNEGYKQRAIAQKGALSSLVDATEILHGGWGLVADDFDDVKHALQTLKVDLANLVKGLQGAESVKQQAQQELASSQSELAKTFAGPPSQGEPGKGGPEPSIEDEARSFMGGFGGGKKT